MTVDAVLIQLTVGLLTGWAGRSLIGGKLLAALVASLMGSFLGGFFLPRVGIWIGGGMTAEIINALSGAVLLSLPLNFVLRDKAANDKAAPRGARDFAAFSSLRGRAKEPQTPAKRNKIFISYRRDDSRDVTGRIYDRLIR